MKKSVQTIKCYFVSSADDVDGINNIVLKWMKAAAYKGRNIM